MKNIAYIGAWHYNFGDRVIEKSCKDILQNKIACNFTHINCQATYFSKHLINYINHNYDMMFVAGGGLLYSRPQDKSVSGWQFNIKKEDLENIKVPMVINAIGYNSQPHDTMGFGSDMWEHLQKTINSSTLFSVRNYGTFNKLKENGIDTSKIEITPDCGMFIQPHQFDSAVFDNSFKIGLNWASDRIEQRFLSSWENKLSVVLAVCKKYTKSIGAKVYLIEHLVENETNLKTKSRTKEIFKNTLGSDGIIISDVFGKELYPPFEYNAGMFADIYRQMNIVYGMRGHSTILSFGQNIPFVGLGQHNKIKWFSEDVGFKDFIIPLNQTDADDYDDLIMATHKILGDIDGHKSAMKKSFDIQKEKKDKWFEKVIEVLK